MKQVFTKIISIILAFLVLFSTFSFTVESHFCGDFLMDISFTGNAEVCESDIVDDFSIKMKDCCSDEIHKIEGQDELQHASELKFDLKKQQFLTAFLISYKDLFIESTSEKTVFQDFSPPDISIDYQVLYQSFLI
ncbi:HYC_CC_PP family protein [Polaribacter aestuariivivens]|uniref:HYC_CC_PP family protein n=1 Tax=Polaribacter aestuariivivens TaxID=2304626 RepID=UPI003F49A25E